MAEEITIKVKLQQANAAAREAFRTGQAFREAGRGVKEFGEETEHAHRRSFLFNQVLFTSRRLLFSFTLGVAAGSTALAGLGIRFDATMEQARIGMSFLTGSVSTANQEIQDLMVIAHKTIFDLPHLLEAGRRMLGMGFSVEETNTALMAMSENMAAMNQPIDTMDRIITAFGQIRARGKLAGQELLQLVNAQVPVYEILRDELGLTAKQLSNIATAGIPANIAIAAITEGMTKRFGGANKALLNSVAGQWEKFRENLEIIMGAIMMTPFNIIEKNFPRALAVMEEMTTAMQERGFFAMVEVFDRGVGAGGRFTETLVHLQNSARDLVAIVQGSLWPALRDVVGILWFFAKPVLFLTALLIHLATKIQTPLSWILRVLIAIWIAHRLVVFKNWLMLRKWNGTVAQSIKWVIKMIAALKKWAFAEKLVVDRQAGTTTLLKKNTGLLPKLTRGIFGAVAATRAWIVSLITLRITILGIPVIGWILAIITVLIMLEMKWHIVSRSIAFFWGLLKRMFNWFKSTRFFKILSGIVGGAAKVVGAVGGFIGLQRGGTVTRSGGFVVGERGPEIVHLPAGSAVSPIPAHGLNMAAMAGAGGVNVTIMPQPIHLDGRMIAEIVWKHKLDKFARR